MGTQLSSSFVLIHSPNNHSSGHLKDVHCQLKGWEGEGNQVPSDNVLNLESEGTCQLWGYSCSSFPRVLCRGKLDCQ